LFCCSAHMTLYVEHFQKKASSIFLVDKSLSSKALNFHMPRSFCYIKRTMLLRITVYPLIFICPGHRNNLVDNQTISSWNFTPKESSRPPKLDECRPQTKKRRAKNPGSHTWVPVWVPRLGSPFGLPVWVPRLGSPWRVTGTFGN